VYYKVTAVVTGFGETGAASLTVAEANAVMSSTNSLQLLWNSVVGATSYNLYRSTVSASTYFYLLTNTAANVRTWIDDDAYTTTEGAAYAAATLPGGNLYVDNDITSGDDVVVGDDLSVAGDTTITGALTVTGAIAGPPETLTLAAMNAASRTAGTMVYVSDGVSATKICVSTATVGGFVLITSTSTHCQ
jgi:predicted RecA/RadA family phage recombinase